jgi:class 3 adenylate cyclase
LPSGTVTFLFTDIKGSTRLWETAGAAMRDALEQHDAVVRDAIVKHDGHVFATGGDRFAAAFHRAAAAAVNAQAALADTSWPAASHRARRPALRRTTHGRGRRLHFDRRER